MVAGIVIQILWFAFFVVVALSFNFRLHREPTARSRDTPWKRHLRALYIASIFIMIRSIVRMLEFIQGHGGYIISHEAFLYIFDAVLMLIVMIILNVVHPSEVYALLRGGKMTRGLQLHTVHQQSLAYS